MSAKTINMITNCNLIYYEIYFYTSQQNIRLTWNWVGTGDVRVYCRWKYETVTAFMVWSHCWISSRTCCSTYKKESIHIFFSNFVHVRFMDGSFLWILLSQTSPPFSHGANFYVVRLLRLHYIDKHFHFPTFLTVLPLRTFSFCQPEIDEHLKI